MLESPRAVHPRAPLEDVDARPRDEAEEVARLEADLLHAEMARRLVHDVPEAAREAPVELPLAVEPDEVLGEVEHPGGGALGLGAGNEARILVLQHAAAARARHDHVVP